MFVCLSSENAAEAKLGTKKRASLSHDGDVLWRILTPALAGEADVLFSIFMGHEVVAGFLFSAQNR